MSSRTATTLTFGRVCLVLAGLVLVLILLADMPAEAQTPTAPAPTGLTATAPTETRVTLSWNSVTNAYRHKLEASTSSTGPWVIVGYGFSSTTFKPNTLDCNTTYYFRVSARGDGSPYSTAFGNPSAASDPITTSQCTNPTNRAPAPTGLRVTSYGQTVVRLSWNAVDDVVQYHSQHGNTSTGPWHTIRFASGITRRNETYLECNTTYYFRVSARGDGSPYSTAFGNPSSVVSQTTSPCSTPSISISGLVTSMQAGQRDGFTVSASNLVSSHSYTIRVTTSDDDIGFNSSCSDRQEDATIPAGRTLYSTTFTLHGCNTSGGRVTATLRSGSTSVATKYQDVTVTAAPSIDISRLVTSMVAGESDSFKVSASNLVSSHSYTIRVTTNNGDIGFNSSCSDRQEDATIPAG